MLFLLTSLASAVSIDEPHTGGRPQLLDIHAGADYNFRGVALGLRYGIPIVNNGFVPPINNSVYINFGADIYNTYYGFGDSRRGVALGVPVALQWNFYFTEQWSAFAELGVNLFFGPGTFRGDGIGGFDNRWIISAVGGRFHINETLALQVRLGNPYTSVGLEFAF